MIVVSFICNNMLVSPCRLGDGGSLSAMTARETGVDVLNGCSVVYHSPEIEDST